MGPSLWDRQKKRKRESESKKKEAGGWECPKDIDGGHIFFFSISGNCEKEKQETRHKR